MDAQTSFFVSRFRRWSFALTWSIPPLVLAVSYLWGVVFYETYWEVWGFSADDFPIDGSRVYVEGFQAFLAVFMEPMSWISRYETWRTTAAVCVIVAGAGLAAVIWNRPFLRTWRKRSRARRLTERSLAELSSTAHKAVTWYSYALMAVAALPVLTLVVSMLGLLLVLPPYLVANSKAHRDVAARTYERWPLATWSDTSGHAETGRLKGCGKTWCGIVKDGQALLVPVSQMKRAATQLSSGKGESDSASDARQ